MGKFWLVFLLFFFSLCANAQSDAVPLKFQKITIEQGLPHNFVHSVTQDKKGFIWIGTNYGLARYDGYNFKVFQPDAEKPYSITHKPIGKLFVDSKDFLWLSINSGGINKMDLQTERFVGYFFDSTKTKSLGVEVRFFHEDRDSNLWLATSSGLFLYNREKDLFINALVKKTFKSLDNYVLSLADDNTGNLWMLLGGKLCILDKKTFNIITIGQFASNLALDTVSYTNLYSSIKGEVWVTTERNGLMHINSQTHKLDFYLKNILHLANVLLDKKDNLYAVIYNPTYKLLIIKKAGDNYTKFDELSLFDSKFISRPVNFSEDNFGNIWLYSQVGLAKYNPTIGLVHYKANNLLPNNISDDYIEHVFIDRTDNLWICPYRKGLNKADLRQKSFKVYAPEIKSLKDILADKNVSSVYKDSKGNTWVGNSNFGVGCYLKSTGKYYRLSFNTSDPVISIYEDNDGYYWFGTYWDVLFKVKIPDLMHPTHNDELNSSQITSYNIRGVRKIVKDNKNNLWFASNLGLTEWDRKKNTFINHSALYDTLNSLSSFYRTIYIDKNQIIWTGSNSGGLCSYNRSMNRFKHYLPDSKNNKTISNATVYAIYEDKMNRFWIGTGQGLENFDRKTEIFNQVGIGNELSKRSIFSIIPDSLGNLWLSCDIGIIKYNIQSQQCFYYGQADGLLNNEFNTTASFLSNTGEIFFGGSTGVVSFFPSEIKANPIHAKPVITNFLFYNKVISPGDSINGRILLEKQVWETNKIELYHYESDFTIEFSALHYSAPEKVKYQYKLEGLNSEWINTDSKRRYASYTGLPPGEYTFVLKATNNDGLECKPEDVVYLSIIIIPPFWLTLWFRLLVVIILIAFVLLFIKYRLNSLRKTNILLNKKVKERTFELEEANAFLEERTRELEDTNSILEERQEEINLQKEEILAQYETLENTNHLLQRHQKQIEEQNIELDKHRNKLEQLVDERTQELEKALTKAEESDKLKTSFLTNMSHEIRTPMNAILGFSSLLKDESLSDERDEFINIIESNGKTLLTLINDILELSSIQSQQMSLKPLNNNLNSILQKLHETFKIETDKKNIALKLNTEAIPKDYYIAFDEIRLKQVITNLLSNAIKFTDTGYVEFGIHEINEKITFYIKDTGIGIPEDIGNSVFERFYKIESNNAHLYRGTGLGLAICQNIVSLWQGDIWYESAAGKGTTFFFTLPVSKENKIQSDSTIISSQELNLKGKRILIAEDELSNYKLLEKYLKKTEASIIWAHNGLEALQAVKDYSVDLVIMDIKMPLMDGIEASKQIKQLFPNLPIIAQTAFAFKNEVEDILCCGVNAYITKPINRPELFALINKYL